MACHAASRAQFGCEGLAATAVDAALYDVNRRPGTPPPSPGRSTAWLVHRRRAPAGLAIRKIVKVAPDDL
jgi:hypothetical protein